MILTPQRPLWPAGIENGRKMKRIIEKFESPLEFVCLLFIFIVSAYFFIVSFSFSDGDELFPRLTSGAALICTVVYFLRSLFGPESEDGKTAEKMEGEDSPFNKQVIVSAVLFFAYFVCVWLFGFLLTSAVFAIIYPLCFRYRSTKGIVCLFLVNAAIVLAFQKLMGMTLSRGVLIDLTRIFF